MKLRPCWLNPASVLSYAIRLALTRGATIRTHRKLPPMQYILWL